MLFALICKDKPGHLSVRQSTRDAHLAFLGALGDDLIFAGPTLDDAGAMDGSIVVIRAADKDGAAALAAREPYNLAGLFASVEIKAWKWVLNRPEGLGD